MNARFSLRDLTLLLILLAIGTYFTLRIPNYEFLNPDILMQLVVEFAIAATLATGMLLVILPGHIDLSAGSGVGLIGSVATVLVAGTGPVCKYLGSFHQWLGATFGPGVAAWCPPPPWPDPVVMLICAVLAILVWGAMGRFIVREHIQAFIITLGGMLIFKGLFWRVLENRTIAVNGTTMGKSWAVDVGGTVVDVPQDWLRRSTIECLSPSVGLWVAGVASFLLLLGGLRAWAQRRKLGIEGDDFELTFVKWLIAAQALFLFTLVANLHQGVPLPAVIFGVIAWMVHTLTTRTRFGRYLYAIGGNEEAAVVSGVNVKRVTTWAFALMGLLVAITGFLQASYTSVATTTAGDGMELNAVAACVIGGVSLKGGRGTVFGVILGSLIMAVLEKGMLNMNVGPENKFIVRGTVLVLAVWVDTRISRKAR